MVPLCTACFKKGLYRNIIFRSQFFLWFILLFVTHVKADEPPGYFGYYYMYNYAHQNLEVTVEDDFTDPNYLPGTQYKMAHEVEVTYYVRTEAYNISRDLSDAHMVTQNKVCYMAINTATNNFTPNESKTVIFEPKHYVRTSDNYAGRNFYLSSRVFNSKEVAPTDLLISVRLSVYLINSSYSNGANFCIDNIPNKVSLGSDLAFYGYWTDAAYPGTFRGLSRSNTCCLDVTERYYFEDCSNPDNMRHMEASVRHGTSEYDWSYDFTSEYSCYSPILSFPSFHHQALFRDKHRSTGDLYADLKEYRSLVLKSPLNFKANHPSGFHDGFSSGISSVYHEVQGRDYFTVAPAFISRWDAQYCNNVRVFSNLDMRGQRHNGQPKGMTFYGGVPDLSFNYFNENLLDAMHMNQWILEMRVADVYDENIVNYREDFMPIYSAFNYDQKDPIDKRFTHREYKGLPHVNTFLYTKPNYEEISDRIDLLLNATRIGAHRNFLQDNAYRMWRMSPPLDIQYNPFKVNPPLYTMYQFRVKEVYYDRRVGEDFYSYIYTHENQIPLGIGKSRVTLPGVPYSFTSDVVKEFKVFPDLNVSNAKIEIEKPCVSGENNLQLKDFFGKVTIKDISGSRANGQGYTYEIYGHSYCTDEMHDIVKAGELDNFVNNLKSTFPKPSGANYEAQMENLRLIPGEFKQEGIVDAECGGDVIYKFPKYTFDNTYNLPPGVYWIRAIPFSPVYPSVHVSNGTTFTSKNKAAEKVIHNIWGVNAHWLNGGQPIVIYPEECYVPYCIALQEKCDVLGIDNNGNVIMSFPVFYKGTDDNALKTGLQFCVDYDQSAYHFKSFEGKNGFQNRTQAINNNGRVCFNGISTNSTTSSGDQIHVGNVIFTYKRVIQNIETSLQLPPAVSLVRDQPVRCNTSFNLRMANDSLILGQDVVNFQIGNIYNNDSMQNIVMMFANRSLWDSSLTFNVYINDSLLADSNAASFLNILFFKVGLEDSLEYYSQKIIVNRDSLEGFTSDMMEDVRPSDSLYVMHYDSIYIPIFDRIDSVFVDSQWVKYDFYRDTLVGIDTIYSDTAGYTYSPTYDTIYDPNREPLYIKVRIEVNAPFLVFDEYGDCGECDVYDTIAVFDKVFYLVYENDEYQEYGSSKAVENDFYFTPPIGYSSKIKVFNEHPQPEIGFDSTVVISNQINLGTKNSDLSRFYMDFNIDDFDTNDIIMYDVKVISVDKNGREVYIRKPIVVYKN